MAAEGCVTAMTDTSDGLAADLGQIARASGCGIQLKGRDLPVRAALQRVARCWGQEPLALILGSSDDYQLVFTCDPAEVKRIVGLLMGRCPVAVIVAAAQD